MSKEVKEVKRRLGKVIFTRASVEGSDIVEVLKKLAFIPYRVEYLSYEDNFEYIGVSKLFEEHIKGQPVPTYVIEIGTVLGEDLKPFIKSVKAIKLP